MIKKHQYCFANISATKARIFMKYYLVVNYYLASVSFKFHDHPCIKACALAINRARTCLHVYNSCWRIYAHIFMKFETEAYKIVINHHIKFHEDPTFIVKIFAKQYWNFLIIHILFSFHLFPIIHL